MRVFLPTIPVIIALTFTLAGCVQQQTANVSNSAPINATTPAPASSPQMVKTNASDADSMPVTLPVLDAFFADESFSAELKSKLQLTDDEVARLRKVARDETAKLRETDSDEYQGTTSAASAHASEEIKAIIGDEKTKQLSEFLRQRGSGANGEGNSEEAHATTSGKFNVVPTD